MRIHLSISSVFYKWNMLVLPNNTEPRSSVLPFITLNLWNKRFQGPQTRSKIFIQPVHPKGDQSWVFFGRTDVEAETPILWPPDVKSWLIWKDPDGGKDWWQEEKEWQRMRWLDGITNSMDVSLSPMNRSTPGLPVHHQLPEFTQTHMHQVGDEEG